MRRKICVFTSSRADYGLLYWTMKKLQSHPGVNLQILCSGTHLSAVHGNTYREIERDGFSISRRCEMLLGSDSPVAVCKSMAVGLLSYTEALEQLQPDLLLLLGDRYETLAAAIAAGFQKIPIAHCHGGELSLGALDDAYRHSISKLSHIHFCCSAGSRRRLLQLGEQADRIFQVSALGVESILELEPLTRQELSQSLGFDLNRPYFLCTYHPQTLGNQSNIECLEALLQAFDHFPEHGVIFTLANADADNHTLNQKVLDYVHQSPKRCLASTSLGQHRYLSAMAHSTAVVGNSSSGILEAPTMRKATLNIGERQRGRERASSVVDCQADLAAIRESLALVCSQAFQQSLEYVKSPYGNGRASETIVKVLCSITLDQLMHKTFVDMPAQ